MIPLFVLFAFIPTGLIGAIVDTVYLHRLKAAIRASGSAAPLDAMLRPPRPVAEFVPQWSPPLDGGSRAQRF